jgi:hypothetical protein
MLISRTKKRYPVFGSVYRYLRLYRCEGCGQDVKMWENWNGPKPNGAIRCPFCEAQISI